MFTEKYSSVRKLLQSLSIKCMVGAKVSHCFHGFYFPCYEYFASHFHENYCFIHLQVLSSSLSLSVSLLCLPSSPQLMSNTEEIVITIQSSAKNHTVSHVTKMNKKAPQGVYAISLLCKNVTYKNY